MTNYYLRPDGAYIKIDEDNKIVINVLVIAESKFIGYMTNVDYVDSMINMANNGVLTPSDEATFNAAFLEAKTFINSL